MSEAMEATSRSAGSGGPLKEYDMSVGCIGKITVSFRFVLYAHPSFPLLYTVTLQFLLYAHPFFPLLFNRRMFLLTPP